MLQAHHEAEAEQTISIEHDIDTHSTHCLLNYYY